MTAISPPGKAPAGRRVRYLNFMLSLTNDTTALAAVFRSLGDLAITEEQLRANNVPVLSIVGTDDPLRRGVDRMTGVMANHKAVYIEGGNHLTTLSDPKFLQTIREFLKNPVEYVGAAEPQSQVEGKEAA
jgi:pimeloyl-ACP methyl ester carboxylesterase